MLANGLYCKGRVSHVWCGGGDRVSILIPLCACVRVCVCAGSRANTWWTVDARAPEPDSTVQENTARALSILLKILGMRLLQVRGRVGRGQTVGGECRWGPAAYML